MGLIRYPVDPVNTPIAVYSWGHFGSSGSGVGIPAVVAAGSDFPGILGFAAVAGSAGPAAVRH